MYTWHLLRFENAMNANITSVKRDRSQAKRGIQLIKVNVSLAILSGGMDRLHTCRTLQHCHAVLSPIWVHGNPGCDYRLQTECESGSVEPVCGSTCWCKCPRSNPWLRSELISELVCTSNPLWAADCYLCYDQRHASSPFHRYPQSELEAWSLIKDMMIWMIW